MSDKAEDPTANSLGLDFESLKVADTEASTAETKEAPPTESEGPVTESKQDDETSLKNGTSEDAASTEDAKPTSPQTANAKEKKKQPYVNPDRVKTGGAQRVCFTLSL